MLNFLLICGLFVLVFTLFVQLSSIKSRLRLLEYLLEKQQKNTPETKSSAKSSVVETMSVSEKIKPVPIEVVEKIAHQPATQGLFSILFQKIYSFFTSGNSFVRIGILLLFIGVTFLLKYAVQTGYFSVEARLISVAIFAVTLYVIGFLLEKKRFIYAVTLEGGALAILYLLCFTSFYHYHILSAAVTFILLILITAFTIISAIRHNVKTLAVMGIIGGFIAPLLISSETQNYALLYSYYLILNIGIFSTAWFRNWRMLNILGFIFTFVITALGYWKGYSVTDFYISELFLFVFFTFYLIVAVLTALNQPVNLKGYIESTLVFALPAVVFALQASLMNFVAHPMAITAICLGVLYTGLSIGIYYLTDQSLRILSYAFAAIALIFFTVAVPLILSGEQTSAIWALEGAALIWVGIKQQRYLMRLLGICIGILANLYFYSSYPEITHLAWFSNEVLNNGLLTFTNLLSAYFLSREFISIKPMEKFITYLFFIFGSLWWLAAIFHATIFYFSENIQAIGFLTLISVSALIAMALDKISNWSWFKTLSFSLLPLMILLAFEQHFLLHFFFSSQLIAWYWIIGFLVWYFILWNYRTDDSEYLDFSHIIAYVLLTWLLSWHSSQHFVNNVNYSNTWVWCVWGAVPALLLLTLHFSLPFIKKVFQKFINNYSELLSLGFVIYLLCWMVIANLQLEGIASPWSYLLLLNPLDLSCIFLLIVLGVRYFCGENPLIKISYATKFLLGYALAIVSFIWANAAILRFLHFSYAVPFSTAGFLDSQLTQVVLSLFWGLTALITTVLANQKQWRPVWFVGAVMIAITILKLFIVDLNNFDTLDRVIAFISVGVILLLIGYFAPLPPKSKTI